MEDKQSSKDIHIVAKAKANFTMGHQWCSILPLLVKKVRTPAIPQLTSALCRFSHGLSLRAMYTDRQTAKAQQGPCLSTSPDMATRTTMPPHPYSSTSKNRDHGHFFVPTAPSDPPAD
uniref:Uncharacterized protein n=1 Tax=Eutreptiella gymnastica TaxID=73025 RepID=A0A7S4CFZ1_9EUGL